MKAPFPWEHAVGAAGFALLPVAHGLGLFYAPPEVMMGDVARILYVHVPAAWICMLVYTIGFVGAVGYFWTGRMALDHLVEACLEVGVVLNVLLILLGSIFAKPTWGYFWTWDPRITTSTVMLLSFVGILLLRAAVQDLDKRALWTAGTTVLAYVNIPVTYMSVRWWASLHQMQSGPDTLSKIMVGVLHVNNLAFLLVTIWFLARRYRIAKAAAKALSAPPLTGVA